MKASTASLILAFCAALPALTAPTENWEVRARGAEIADVYERAPLPEPKKKNKGKKNKQQAASSSAAAPAAAATDAQAAQAQQQADQAVNDPNLKAETAAPIGNGLPNGAVAGGQDAGAQVINAREEEIEDRDAKKKKKKAKKAKKGKGKKKAKQAAAAASSSSATPAAAAATPAARRFARSF